MATYHVNSAGGEDFQTLAQVNAATFAGDDFILFNKGQTWAGTLIPHDSGTAGHQITYGAYGSGEKPIIDGAGVNYCISDAVGRGFITIDGLHLQEATLLGIAHTKWPGAEGSTPGWIVQHCTFTHCGMHLYGPDTIVQDNVMVGPQITTTESFRGAIIISGAVASNCFVLRNTISGYYYRGIWFLNTSPSPTANDNIISDMGIVANGAGIDFDGYGSIITGTVTCLRNTISGCPNLAIQYENCSDGSLSRGNLIHDCGFGIYYINYAACARYAEQRGRDVNGEISYNIIYHCNRSIILQGASTVNIWNNVLDDCTGAQPYGLAITAATAQDPFCSEHINCQNNIIGGGNDSVFLKRAYELIFDVFDYNQVKGALFFEYDTSSHVSLATAQGEGAALHCFTNSPAFVDAAGHDFHLTAASPCIGAAVDVGLTEDFDGNPIT